MMKLLIPTTLVLTTAFAGYLLPEGKISQSSSEWAYSLPDTLPDEYFGEPLNREPIRDPREERLRERYKPQRVIPVIPVATDTTHTMLLEIPDEYNGFKIEIKAVREELPPGHDIFFHHGNLSMEMLPDSTYSYTLGNFAELKKAEQFLREALKDRYPEAKVVEYRQGQRNEQN